MGLEKYTPSPSGSWPQVSRISPQGPLSSHSPFFIFHTAGPEPEARFQRRICFHLFSCENWGQGNKVRAPLTGSSGKVQDGWAVGEGVCALGSLEGIYHLVSHLVQLSGDMWTQHPYTPLIWGSELLCSPAAVSKGKPFSSEVESFP